MFFFLIELSVLIQNIDKNLLDFDENDTESDNSIIYHQQIMDSNK